MLQRTLIKQRRATREISFKSRRSCSTCSRSWIKRAVSEGVVRKWKFIAAEALGRLQRSQIPFVNLFDAGPRNFNRMHLCRHPAAIYLGKYRTPAPTSRTERKSVAFWARNALAGLASNSTIASRGVDLLRALMIKRQGQYFLRGGLGGIPAQFSLVGDDDVLPRDWGPLTQRLYRMFQHRIADHLTKFRSPFNGSRNRGPDAVHGLAFGDLRDGAAGFQQVIRRLYQGCRSACDGQPVPEVIRMGRRKVGFNSPMPEWLNGPLSSWTAGLLDRQAPAFAELVDEPALRKTVGHLTSNKCWDWETVGRIWPYLNMKWILAGWA